MTDENPSTVIVNMHGLLGEQEVIQMEFEAELLVEQEQFVFDNVAYEIVRIINEDVEYPVVYVVILDILSQTWSLTITTVFPNNMPTSLQNILHKIKSDSTVVEQ